MKFPFRPSAPPRVAHGSAILVENLAKDFGHFRAVDNISFQVPPGRIFGFLGPNGSGKTTTIRMLLGLLHPTSGAATVLGYDVARHATQVRPRLGYVSQRFSLYDDLTVIENLKFYGRTYGLMGSRLNERIAVALKLADLVGREKELARNLSGGWRQRLALGAAILHQPDLVFLDEPTAGVDPVSRRIFWDLLYDLAAGGTTIFVTTHYMDEAENCEDLAFIYNGRIIARGSPAQVKTAMMRGQVLELNPDNPALALSALRAAQAAGALSLEEVSLYGAQVHVVALAAEKIVPSIKKALKAAGVDPGPIAVIEPTLEDVFISCVRAADEEDAAAIPS